VDTGAWDVSEALGSTGVAPNLQKRFTCRDRGADAQRRCAELQLSFSSQHPGVVNVVMCDGSVRSVEESIDALTWSNLGTRGGQVLPLKKTSGPAAN
jgi:prepilin-type processing-associated H-X9-DG protein